MIIPEEDSPLYLTGADFASLKRAINEEDDKKKTQTQKTFQQRVINYLSQSGMEDIIEILNAVVSILIPILYAVETYYSIDTEPEALRIIELILLIFLIM